MAVDDFMAPIETAARTTFLTARAAARHMIPRRSGVILAFGAPATAAGRCATTTWEGRRSPSTRSRRSGGKLVVELGPHGVRVVTLASGGVPESLPQGLDEREKIVEIFVAGRETDVLDAQWLCRLLEAGVLRASLVPRKPIRTLRNLTRYRKSNIRDRQREANRLDKIMEGAGIKLDCVATDLLGKRGRAMLALWSREPRIRTCSTTWHAACSARRLRRPASPTRSTEGCEFSTGAKGESSTGLDSRTSFASDPTAVVAEVELVQVLLRFNEQAIRR
jgi:hypothetical protein